MDLSIDGKALPSLPPHKRSRVLLSCAPCRNSKLKCDRNQPCSQCAKKERPDACVYAPKPLKKKPQPKGMSARLKRLEGMVRSMMDAEAEEQSAQEGTADDTESNLAKGQVVHSEQGSHYVGATHCLAMLEDIEDLKTYFDDEDDDAEGDSPGANLESADLLLNPRGAPNSREELIGYIPEKHTTDRLIMRYFSSSGPSQFCVHRPTFTKKYAQFWNDPDSVSLPWLAQLFMVLALGVIYNHFSAPQELQDESDLPALQRVQIFRACAGWALVWSKYTNPTHETIPAFILYVEAYFIFSRAAQMSCYTLSAVCMRLMLKMGMHRDPSKLASLTPYESEMRRRWWSMACQIEMLVSFHMGLPSMLHSVEWDVEVHSNLQDEDFDEDTTKMPPPRSLQDYTSMSYSINKTRILRVFGQIAKLAHSLTVPSYADTMRLDVALNDAWDKVPEFLRVKPLDQCIGDSPTLLIQRYGIESLYQKARCVLHRRHLTEPVLRSEHDYSRQQCIEAAMFLLSYQSIIWNATRPGNMLSMCGWFVTSLSVHDFMLAAMVVYVAVQNENYPEYPTGNDPHWAAADKRLPSKEALRTMLKRSHAIWCRVSSTVGELRKTRDTLAVMLAKIGCPVDGDAMPKTPASSSSNRVPGGGFPTMVPPPPPPGSSLSAGSHLFVPQAPAPSLVSSGQLSSAPTSGTHDYSATESAYTDTAISNNFSTFNISQFDPNMTPFTGLSGTDAEGRQLSLVDGGTSESSNDGIFGTVEFDSSWIGDGMDWQIQTDIFLANKGASDNLGPTQGMGESWTRNMNLGNGGW